MAEQLVRDFEATADGEWAVRNGDFAAVAGEAAVPQGVRLRLGVILGECYLDEQVGTDYWTIMEKAQDPLVVRAILEEQIAATPDITNVVGADLQREGGTREASISYSYDTVYSTETLADQQAVP